MSRDTALFALLYGSGLRIAEALALNVGDVPTGEGALKVTGKGSKQRLVPVLPAVRRALAALLVVHPDRAPGAALFLGTRGERLNPGVAQRSDSGIRRSLQLAEVANLLRRRLISCRYHKCCELCVSHRILADQVLIQGHLVQRLFITGCLSIAIRTAHKKLACRDTHHLYRHIGRKRQK